MNEKVQIEGRWWIHGKNAPEEMGVLTGDGERIALEVKVRADLSDMETIKACSAEPRIENVIHGLDRNDQPITLLGCVCGDVQTSRRQISYKILPLIGVIGAEIAGWQEPVARAVILKIEYLHRWFADKFVELVTATDGRPAWTERRIELLSFDISDSFTVRFQRSRLPSWSWDEEKHTPNCQIYLIFKENQSLKQVFERWIPWTTNLFSLLIGTTVNCAEIHVTKADPFEPNEVSRFPSAEILYRSPRNYRTRISDPYPPMMFAPFSAVQNQLGVLLQRWDEVSDKLKPVVELFASVAFHHNFYGEARFLFLVQALEIYHTCSPDFESNQLSTEMHRANVEQIVASAPESLKEWTKKKLQLANYKSLGEKLCEIFQRNEPEAKALFGDIQITANRITFTRNHFTHHSSQKDSPRLLQPKEILRVAYALELILWIVLLKELRIEGEPIQRVLKAFENLEVINLE